MTLTGIEAATAGLVLALALMTLVWLASVARRDASLVDRFWGVGFVLLAGFFYATRPPEVPSESRRAALLLVLVAIWGVRLAAHLTVRNWGRGEDFRYRAMRERGGRSFPWMSLVTIHALQAAIMWFVSLSLLAGMRGATASPVLFGLGVVCWAIGFIFEAGADWQLAAFRRNPANRGSVLETGLWRYSRHPNYFGDAAVWWGFFLIAAARGGWWTLLSPLLMTGLLLKVSGVALLEKTLVAAKPRYREYLERTSAFLPWPPRSTPPGSGTG